MQQFILNSDLVSLGTSGKFGAFLMLKKKKISVIL